MTAGTATGGRTGPTSRLATGRFGSGEPVVLVHGSLFDGRRTWARQRVLARHFRLIVPDRRGYGASPPASGEDFERDLDEIVDLLAGGAHLVGHSYGGIVALLAAARAPERVRSLTAVEPPAFGLVRGDPAAESIIGRFEAVWARAADLSPRQLATDFLAANGVDAGRLPDPLPPDLVRGATLLADCRPPWEATFPFPLLRTAGFPALVVSGGHSAAYETVCDRLAAELRAERAVVPGRGHAVPETGRPFNALLTAFLQRQPAGSPPAGRGAAPEPIDRNATR